MGKRLTVGEVADYLHLSTSAVRNIDEAELPVDRTPTRGQHRRYLPSALVAYMRHRGVTPPAKLLEQAEQEG